MLGILYAFGGMGFLISKRTFLLPRAMWAKVCWNGVQGSGLGLGLMSLGLWL